MLPFLLSGELVSIIKSLGLPEQTGMIKDTPIELSNSGGGYLTWKFG
jgi:hypothetical protein